MGAFERRIIIDKESGKDMNKPGYAALKNTILRTEDTHVVVCLDRLCRNRSDIKHELECFHDNKIQLKVLDIPTTLIDPPEG